MHYKCEGAEPRNYERAAEIQLGGKCGDRNSAREYLEMIAGAVYMAEIKQTLERIYIIPLKKEWSKVPSYKRTRKAIVAIKEFIARHMKVYDRDLDKIKVDIYLNNEIWAHGSRNAPTRVKVRAIKDKDIVHVTFADTRSMLDLYRASTRGITRSQTRNLLPQRKRKKSRLLKRRRLNRKKNSLLLS